MAYWIEFIGDRSVRVHPGQSILDAALRAGIPHYHACGGQGQCTTCRVLVRQGAELLAPHTEAEKELLKHAPRGQHSVRLACQAKVLGDGVRLHRIIRDEADRDMYVDAGGVNESMGMDRELALFFLDIRDFTPFMQRFLPFDVIHIMRRLFTLFRSCIERSGGRVIETAGDGLYAAFGWETDLFTAVPSALEAALAIETGLDALNDSYMEPHFRHRFETGIGIHCGHVIMGNVGLGINNNLTVMGLPVNIASRLQTATKEAGNSILLSAEAARYLERPPGDALRVNLHLKGIGEAVPAYRMGRTYPSMEKAAAERSVKNT
ncbi:MAG TPA: adenylate/guanylate cyclase domain-containing protein [Chitinophagaceae bacterium]|nr:adenylate/guanylate cyclase domain-containing protein [Chitinophagaceae bacterium]